MALTLLDLCCGAGGAAWGYSQAGYEVTGVDSAPQPHYPFTFIQADALTFPLDEFDVIHASPPCQAFSKARYIQHKQHPDLLTPLRERLQELGKLWIIENVPGAPMRSPITLCGTHFGLHVYRHRQFESNVPLYAPPCHHPYTLPPTYLSISACKAKGPTRGNRGNHYRRASLAEARAAMGISWMSFAELSQAIPPAYTEYIGRQVMAWR